MMFRKANRFLFELCCVALVFVYAVFFSGDLHRIDSDGTGYYDYLPSLFIHHDLHRESLSDHPKASERVNHLDVYVTYKDYKVDKYPCGAALLLSPFFLATHLFYPGEHTGYESAFQLTVLCGALFYLFIALILLRRLLLTYTVSPGITRWLQFGLVLGTNVIYYSATLPSFSHVYSLFAITSFLYCARQYQLHQSKLCGTLFIALAALIFILRPVNILVVLFLPLIMQSWKDMMAFAKNLLRDPKCLLAGSLLAISLIGIQCFLWHAQTGEFIVDSYQNEHFDFTNPHIVGILFSFQKGLFVYTSILLLLIPALIILWTKNSRFQVWAFLLPFLLITYILSCWHDWVYGHSYGLRAYIEFYPVFFLVIGMALSRLVKGLIATSVFVLLATALNVFQCWQYENYILHWNQMDYHKYCKVFLRSADRFKGIFWKYEIPQKDYRFIEIYSMDSLQTDALTVDTLLNTTIGKIDNGALPNVIGIELYEQFRQDCNAIVEVDFTDSTGKRVLFCRPAYLIAYAEGPFDQYQLGYYWYNLSGFIAKPNDRLLIRVFTGTESVNLKSISVRLATLKSNY